MGFAIRERYSPPIRFLRKAGKAVRTPGLLAVGSYGAFRMHSYVREAPEAQEAFRAYEIAEAEYQERLLSAFTKAFPNEEPSEKNLNWFSNKVRNLNLNDQKTSDFEQHVTSVMNREYGNPQGGVPELYDSAQEAGGIWSAIGNEWLVIGTVLGMSALLAVMIALSSDRNYYV
jgi:hypothetical protein